MNYTIVRKLPSVDNIIAAFPLSSEAEERIANDQQEIKNIIAGTDPRMLVIVGPCSAWPADALVEYAGKLKKVSDELKESLKIVLRLYIEKPRTAKGWTGPVNQPDPFSPPDIEKGISYSRELMVRAIEAGLPIADEAVFTHNARGFIELLSWVAIGARSSEDQEHRIFASAVPCAVGMKNPTSGEIEIGVNSIIAAQHPHTAVFSGYQVETPGNPHAHLVLRGGMGGPNYHVEQLMQAQTFLTKHVVKNPSIIIDASHDNCRLNGKKDPLWQVAVVREVLQTLRMHSELRGVVKGFMIESFLKAGNQSVESCTPETIDRTGLSITDPCLGWEETASLLKEIASESGRV